MLKKKNFFAKNIYNYRVCTKEFFCAQFSSTFTDLWKQRTTLKDDTCGKSVAKGSLAANCFHGHSFEQNEEWQVVTREKTCYQELTSNFNMITRQSLVIINVEAETLFNVFLLLLLIFCKEKSTIIGPAAKRKALQNMTIPSFSFHISCVSV